VRFFKHSLFIFLIIFIFIAIAFFTRNSISQTVANHYLAEYGSKIDCLEFTLDSSLTFDITKLCINSPQATFELENIELQWQFFPKISVTKIKIANSKIVGISELFIEPPQTNNQNKQQTFSFDELSVALQQIAQLNLSTIIEVDKFTYQPFSVQPFTKDKSANHQISYVGQFSANKNTFHFSFDNDQQQDVLSATLTSMGKRFTADLKTDLALLKGFLNDHKLKIPTEITDGLVVKGTLNSRIEWKNKELYIDGQLNELSINLVDIKQDEQIQLNAALNWKMRLIDNMINIDFSKHNEINLTYNEERLSKRFIELLSKQRISPKTTKILTAILNDNPTNGLTISPHSLIEINLADSSVAIAELDIKTENINHPSKLKLTEVFFNYGDLLKPSLSPKQSKNRLTFSIESDLNIAPLQTITKQQIIIKAVGHVNQHAQGWLVHLTPVSKIKLTNIEFIKVEPPKDDVLEGKLTKAIVPAPQVAKSKNTLSINKFVTQFQGDIKTTQSGNLELALNIDIPAHSLVVNVVILIDKPQIKANIKGDLSDINIRAQVKADDVDISSVIVKGSVSQPLVELSAKQLPLTDLLALKLKLPVPMKLIDGELNYHLSGELTDLDNLQNNNADLSVSLKRITGEIDSIWLQEINWQQEFVLTNGQIETLDSEKNNLNVELIEMASPITNLSLKTNISANLQEDDIQINLTGENIDGQMLGGSFHITDASWPINAEHSVNVQLTNIDLEKVLELDKKQGIVVTGRISGHLPIYFDNKNITIKQGELHNISNGLIQVINNPAVEELKANNSQLKLAFDALQNLHYHQLSSDVSMSDDGYMLLETVIKGRNPDLDNDVNLNLNLSYDLLGLLESMTITERFEQHIINDLQKH
jgi:hypothetical protein